MSEPEEIITKSEPTLYDRSLRGGYWVMFSRVLTNILGFAKSLIIVNYFLLNDLGILSAALLTMEVLTAFTQTGFETALIQKKGDIRHYLDTAWTAGVIKGIFLFLLFYVLAPLITSIRIPVEKVPLAISAFRAIGICFLIQGFRNIGAIYFSKDLEFRKIFSLSMASTLTDIILSISLVLAFRSIWGVIAARLVSTVINSAGTYVLSSYRPRLYFAPTRARELWKFGRWIFGSRIIGFLISEGDDFFVWFYLGIQPLALYRTAFRFATTPATHISDVISQVTLPAYAKIQDDLPRLKDAYLKVLKVTAFFSVPLAFLIFILGPDFIQLFLKEHLHPMTLALQILAFKGLMASISSTYGPIFMAREKPRVVWYVAIICLIILAVTIYPFTKMWGIAGTALSTVLFGIVVNPLYFFLTCKELSCSAWSMLQQILFPLCTSVLMGLVLLPLKNLWLQKTTCISFTILVIISLVMYMALSWLLDGIVGFGLKQMLREHLKAFTKRDSNEFRTV